MPPPILKPEVHLNIGAWEMVKLDTRPTQREPPVELPGAQQRVCAWTVPQVRGVSKFGSLRGRALRPAQTRPDEEVGPDGPGDLLHRLKARTARCQGVFMPRVWSTTGDLWLLELRSEKTSDDTLPGLATHVRTNFGMPCWREALCADAPVPGTGG